MEVSSISKKNKNSITSMILTFFLIVLILFAFIYFIMTFIGVGLLTLIGFEYKSIGSVFLFFFIFVCLNIPLDFVSTSILDFIHFKCHVPESFYKLLEFFIEFILVLIVLLLVDTVMRSIYIPFKTKVLFSILLYLFTSSIDFLFLKDKD